MSAKQKFFSTALKTFGFVFVGLLLVHWLTAGHDDIVGQADVMDSRQNAPHSPIAVLSAHENECWGATEQPKAELPGAAIVQYGDGMTIYTKDFDIVDAAFNEALANAGYGDVTTDEFEVVALCI